MLESTAVSSYRRDGIVLIRDGLDRLTVARCLAHLVALQTGRRLTGPMVAVSLPDDEFLRRLAADSALSRIAGCLLGREPIPFGSTYFVKEAGAGQPVLWHQDGYPWQTTLGIAEAVTLWIALDSVDGANGGLRFIPGSHRLAAQPLRPNPHGGNVFGAEIDPVLVDAPRAQVLTMSPGDVSAHHSNLIHGSLPNRSKRSRRALAVRYRPAEHVGGSPSGCRIAGPPQGTGSAASTSATSASTAVPWKKPRLREA